MSPLMLSIIAGLFRVLLAPLVDWLNRTGVLSADANVQFATELTAIVGSAAWAIYAWVQAHRKQATTLAVMNTLTPPTTKNVTSADIDAVMKAGDTAAAATPKDEAPTLTGTGNGLAEIRSMTGTGDGRL